MSAGHGDFRANQRVQLDDHSYAFALNTTLKILNLFYVSKSIWLRSRHAFSLPTIPRYKFQFQIYNCSFKPPIEL